MPAPSPTGSMPSPTGSTPSPTGSTPSPTGSTPSPTGSTPSPTGSMPSPTGSTPKYSSRPVLRAYAAEPRTKNQQPRTNNQSNIKHEHRSPAVLAAPHFRLVIRHGLHVFFEFGRDARQRRGGARLRERCERRAGEAAAADVRAHEGLVQEVDEERGDVDGFDLDLFRLLRAPRGAVHHLHQPPQRVGKELFQRRGRHVQADVGGVLEDLVHETMMRPCCRSTTKCRSPRRRRRSSSRSCTKCSSTTTTTPRWSSSWRSSSRSSTCPRTRPSRSCSTCTCEASAWPASIRSRWPR